MNIGPGSSDFSNVSQRQPFNCAPADGGMESLLRELRQNMETIQRIQQSHRTGNNLVSAGSIATPSSVERYYAEADDFAKMKPASDFTTSHRVGVPNQSASSSMLEPLPVSNKPVSSSDNNSGFDAQETASLLQVLQNPAERQQQQQQRHLRQQLPTTGDEQLFRALSSNLSHQKGVIAAANNDVDRAQLTFAQGLDMSLDAANSNLLSGARGASMLAFGAEAPLNAQRTAINDPFDCVGAGLSMTGGNNEESLPLRFKPFHEEKWSQRLEELRHFCRENGNCLVPHTYPPNPQLARWVKRQRRQYKLLAEGKSSTLTPARVALLEDVGFIWDAHVASWTEKIAELRRYRSRHGNTLVPTGYKPNPSLAVWVKCQRRQYKLYKEGKQSAMNPERIQELEAEGFCWEARTPVMPDVHIQQAQMQHHSAARLFNSMAA